jgi:hypothetical protein
MTLGAAPDGFKGAGFEKSEPHWGTSEHLLPFQQLQHLRNDTHTRNPLYFHGQAS